MRGQRQMDIDIGKEIGAAEGTSIQRLSFYLPNKDRDGIEIPGWEQWVNEARQLLSKVGEGSTAFPPCDGTWINDQSGTVIWEQTRIVYCYVDPDRFVANLKNLREFLHRFGRETNQGQVVVEWDNRFFRIKQYDQPAGG